VNIGSAEELTRAIARDGYTFAHADAMRDLLTGAGALSDWPAFAASWNDLALDRYMADGGRYRRRRHAVTRRLSTARSSAHRTSRTIRAATTTL
jgi:hypothetical protein